MWDERYSGDDFAYGTHPNDFLAAAVDELPVGRVLCLAEGEGRNAVWLARRGFDVTAVDMSRVGLDKARKLADAHGATIRTIHADLAEYMIEPEDWDVIVSIFCHLPPPLRRAVHRQSVAGLREGGVFLLEGFTHSQLRLGTGGPPSADLMMDLETLRDELAGLDLIHAEELERTIHEGEFHNGLSAVVQVVGVKS
ncbi:MAG: class I SAM-dependent methyltransferase [Thermoanaerobaculales bacterium]|jgi:SAM-dependent methyltransferase|nr:class I SAM-dependent methyltransferase [Thermoanaerobaculales bacterium]